MSFVDKTSLDPSIDNILVKCRSGNKQVYVNGHAMMPERREIRERLNMWRKYDQDSKAEDKPPSVLMIGIDSISRVNLIRAMPKTARYLYENEWYEMSGFNKVSKRGRFSKARLKILWQKRRVDFEYYSFKDKQA